jgi:hypothetical protein
VNTPPNKTDLARHRLEILLADDTENNHTNKNILDLSEQAALRIVLDELHRLNTAVSEQRKTLQSIADRRIRIRAKKQPSLKPVGARSPRPKGHSFTGKGAHT